MRCPMGTESRRSNELLAGGQRSSSKQTRMANDEDEEEDDDDDGGCKSRGERERWISMLQNAPSCCLLLLFEKHEHESSHANALVCSSLNVHFSTVSLLAGVLARCPPPPLSRLASGR